MARTPTHALNIALDNQNFTLTESTNFLGTHLDTNLSPKLHENNIENKWV